MSLNESVLVESRTARDNQLECLSHERATEALNRAKALLFAVWQGTGVTTTEEIVRYYDVEASVVRHASKQYRDELISDCWREVKGAENLKSLRSIGCEFFSLPEATTRVAIWTPRAALRLGMVLRDSLVAKVIRTVLLDAVEHIPALTQENERMRLELQLIQAKQRYLETSHAIQLSTSPATLAWLRGETPPPPKVEYRERFIDAATRKEIGSGEGRLLTQLMADAGLNPKSTKHRQKVKRILKSCGFDYDRQQGWVMASYLNKYPVLEDKTYEQALKAVLAEVADEGAEPNLFVQHLQQSSLSRQSQALQFEGVEN